MSAPDSLAAWLHRRSDDELSRLLALRPDLGAPPPSDTAVLATRAGLRVSVARAADELDTFRLTVLEALVLSGADTVVVDAADLDELLGPDADPVQDTGAAVADLRDRGLLWGPDADVEGLRIAPAVREVLGRSGLVGRPSPGLADADVPALLDELDEPRRALLTALAQGSPLGHTRDAATGAPSDRPVPQLLAAGLLLKVDEGTVELPSQVSAALRGTHPMGTVSAREPVPSLTQRAVAEVDAAAAGEALELLRHAELLLTSLEATPAPVLRAGGMGVREVRRLVKLTSVPEDRVVLVLELLAAAGLIASDDAVEPSWTPTTAVDAWRPGEPALRWFTLARGWWELPRLPGLVGRRDAKDKPLAVLAPELRRPAAPRDRRRVLDVLAGLSAGRGKVASVQAAEVERVLTWRVPRWGGRGRGDLVRWTLAEATAIGLVARDALSSPGRALLDAPATAAAAMADALPEPVDHVLVQADLTVVAPGPLQPELANEIALVADVESAGVATVYRVSPESVRRALDSGRSATELHALFVQRSRTPVPQALTYLIDDVARRHGRLRTGTAASFLRCDDETLLAEVLASAVAQELGLRALAPTVSVSAAPLAELLAGLRRAGFAPAAEDAAGAVLDLRPPGARVTLRAARRSAAPPAPATAEQREAAVRGMRAGDRAAAASTADRVVSDGSRTRGLATMALLQQAARDQHSCWIGYVDAQGVASQRVVEPISVGGGVLEAFDPATRGLRRFALHRITTAALATE
ncbi:MAG: helicase-associated domain-containing protein [Mycobacteriaceae bacterium]